MKPRVFIGSSTEALEVAHAIQENLEHDALCKVWTQGIFDLSGSALDNLLTASLNFDFAVFVFQPDDITKIRACTAETVRDNVVFELGLFIGKLGKEKVYFLVPANSEGMHFPTDLLSITPGSYVPPETNGDLLAALGPFCNKMRRQMKSFNIPIGNNVPSSSIATSEERNDSDKKPEQVKDDLATPQEALLKEIEDGIKRDEFGNFIISRAPTAFFDNRVCKAIPGVRGLQCLPNSKEALDRLQCLLQEPISFETANGYGIDREPIWLWRGYLSYALSRFLRLSQTRCLLDIFELEIERIAVWRSESYRHSFVYVEVCPDQPIGLYKEKEDDVMNDMVSFRGYVKEEYGLYQNTPITRACYDDGAAFLDGEIVDVSGASLRVHYLTKYNFLIASKSSPINSHEFDKISEPILNNILKGGNHLDELCRIIERLPRSCLDN